jgi:hypothetical protein
LYVETLFPFGPGAARGQALHILRTGVVH